MNRPLAYFITFHTHGTWLHGRAEGSVDRQHNQPNTPFLPEDAMREAQEKSMMSVAGLLLDDARRAVVRNTIIEVCHHRQWHLHALHVRTNHVHAIVTASDKAEKVMNDLKAWCTRRLREAKLLGKDEAAWARHGSTIYVWNEKALDEKIDYTLNQQGSPLRFARYPECDDDAHPSRNA